MNSNKNPTRRNRNIGTAKQGHGRRNKFRLPLCCIKGDLKWYYENLQHYDVTTRNFPFGNKITFLVENVFPGFVHACTVDDIAAVLVHVSPDDLDGIKMIILRQPKRKEVILNPVWGRLVFFAEIVENKYEGRTIFLEAMQPNVSFRWNKSLTPEDQAEFDRLQNAGHDIRSTQRYHVITPSIDSIRYTQLYHTLLHEVGHHVDEKKDPDLFDHKGSGQKEAFAHRYADKLRTKLEKFGALPFPRILSEQSILKDKLRLADFNLDLNS